MELKPEIERERLFFHVTPTRNLPRILVEGLQPQVGARSEQLGEGFGIFLFESQIAAKVQ